MKQIINSLVVVFCFAASAIGSQALAQSTSPGTAPAEQQAGEPVVEESATEALMAEVERLRSELHAVLEESTSSAGEIVRNVSGAQTLSDVQILGIAAGLVGGALLADLLGGGGLVTISLAAGGSVLGSWIAGAI